MERRRFLRSVGVLAGAAVAPWLARAQAGKRRLNVLFITADDMNCDSVGVFGARVPGITPHTDALAGQGVRFVHAHVQVANCVPSRNVMQTGRYPHSSGVEGFYKLQTTFPILPDVLKKHGYVVGIKNKVAHSTPYHPYPWDLVVERSAEKGAARSPRSFHAFVKQGVELSTKAGKPFYLVANVTDPHKPFYGEPKSEQMGFDSFPPSKTYPVDKIPVPGFLPDLPEVRLEVKRYYDSVRRADDCVGEALRALKESGQAPNTVVMFLSDHGMPFPFAKTNVWHHSTRTPWIVRWPGTVRPGTVDSRHMISSIDFMPTVLDIAGIDPPDGLQGRSFAPLLKGQTQAGRDYVIKEYNENAGGARHPMRSVETRNFCYIFNPWSNGTRVFRTATQGTTTYKLMKQLAATDAKIAARLKHFDHRTLEEFYDTQRDPNALRNLIGDPRHAKEIARHRAILEAWMVKTADPCLEVFRKRHDVAFREAYMKAQQDASDERRKKGRSQKRGGRKQAGLIRLVPPQAVARGKTVTVTIHHKLAAQHGEQQLHVTAKCPDNRRIERKVVTVKGAGSVDVPFEIPDDKTITEVLFAAFVGKDFPSCLQHVVTKPVPVR
ncbi:MAG: sulfatase [Candidatus Brocadiae bacterium]|nr:sulfatase [Candidatus Brocadiia bacterium]